MDKGDANSNLDFDMDPEFNENFYKNLDKVLNDLEVDEVQSDNLKSEDIIDNDDIDLSIILEDEGAALAQSNSEAAVSSEQVENNHTDFSSQEAESVMNEEASETDNEDNTEDVEDELSDINASLAKQICEELNTETAAGQNKRKTMPLWLKIQSSVAIGLLCIMSLVLFLGFTKPGNKLLFRMGVDLSGKIWATWTQDFKNNSNMEDDYDYIDESDVKSEAPEVDINEIGWEKYSGTGRYEEGVFNILLLGEEAIGSGTARGRTDLIIIATLNSKTKKVKLTSLMRDTLVQIPGYQDNRLNSAYEKGGVKLLYETISLNFDIRLDGCVMVNFDNFEKIIDRLGGLEITLTKGEASYLRTTNYISKPQYRNVKEGKQTLNGNQVLGYSRIRKRATITGNNNDYGRTDRHKIILHSVFEKYKTRSKIDLAQMMVGILPMLTTDIDSNGFELLLNTFIEMGTMEIDNLRIPADGAFTDNVKVRGMEVLIPDLPKNVEVLHNFIFGE